MCVHVVMLFGMRPVGRNSHRHRDVVVWGESPLLGPLQEDRENGANRPEGRVMFAVQPHREVGPG